MNKIYSLFLSFVLLCTAMGVQAQQAQEVRDQFTTTKAVINSGVEYQYDAPTFDGTQVIFDGWFFNDTSCGTLKSVNVVTSPTTDKAKVKIFASQDNDWFDIGEEGDEITSGANVSSQGYRYIRIENEENVTIKSINITWIKDPVEFSILCFDKTANKYIDEAAVPMSEYVGTKLNLVAPTIEGYAVVGESTKNFFVSDPQADITFEYEKVAQDFNILCYDKATNVLIKTIPMTADAGKVTTITAPVIDNYTFAAGQDQVKSFVVSKPQLDVIFYYETVKPTTYQIVYTDEKGVELAERSELKTATEDEIENGVELQAKAIDGYIANKARDIFSLEKGKKNLLTFVYRPAGKFTGSKFEYNPNVLKFNETSAVVPQVTVKYNGEELAEGYTTYYDVEEGRAFLSDFNPNTGEIAFTENEGNEIREVVISLMVMYEGHNSGSAISHVTVKQLPKDETITIKAGKEFYAYSPSHDVMIPEDLEVWYVTGVSEDNKTVYCSKVDNALGVARGEGVLLRRSEFGEKNYSIPVTAKSLTRMSSNCLIGTLSPVTVAEGEAYAFVENSTKKGFYPLAASTIPANRSYLPASVFSSSALAPEVCAVSFDGAEMTPIEDLYEDLQIEKTYTDGIYTLDGKKVQSPTAPGLYIVNGKKVMVK